MDNRPHIVTYHMRIADLVATRSTCRRRNVGAVAVKKNRMIATGYNGAVPGMAHCSSCLRNDLGIPSGQQLHLCRALHAEQNLLTQASVFGVSLENSTFYVTNQPCFTCVKLLVALNPMAVIYRDPYPDEQTIKFMEDNNWIELSNELDGTEYHILLPKGSQTPLVQVFRGEL